MSYQALYRRYRPKDFNSIVDQEIIVKTLKNALVNNKISHAYLFSGPRGTGKTSIAKIFAKSINCTNRFPDGNPCMQCDSCINISKGSSCDVFEMDAASNNGTDDIKQLIDGIRYLPTNSLYKIYIIDEVHMLSNQAFNALLKTLEEPPKHVIFILATTEESKLPITVTSRVQRIIFKPITIDGLFNQIKFICKKEGVEITDEAALEIASISDGALRDALSLLDQVISFTNKVDILSIQKISGNISDNEYFSLLKSICDGDTKKAIDIKNDILLKGRGTIKVLNDFLIFLTNIYEKKLKIDIPRKSLFSNTEFLKYIYNLEFGLISNIINDLIQTINNIKQVPNSSGYVDYFIIKNSNLINKKNISFNNNHQTTKQDTMFDNLNINFKNNNSSQINKLGNIDTTKDEFVDIKVSDIVNIILNNNTSYVNILSNIPTHVSRLFPGKKIKCGDFTVEACTDKEILLVFNESTEAQNVYDDKVYKELLTIINSYPYTKTIKDIIAIGAFEFDKIKDNLTNKMNQNIEPKDIIIDEFDINVKKKVKKESNLFNNIMSIPDIVIREEKYEPSINDEVAKNAKRNGK